MNDMWPSIGDSPPDYRLKISWKALNFIPWIIDCTTGEFQWSVANLHNALGGVGGKTEHTQDVI